MSTQQNEFDEAAVREEWSRNYGNNDDDGEYWYVAGAKMQHAQLKEKLAEAHKRIEFFEHKGNLFEESIRHSFKEREDKLTQDLAAAREQIGRLQMQSNEQSLENDFLTTQLTEAQLKLQVAEKDIIEYERANAQMQAEIERLRELAYRDDSAWKDSFENLMINHKRIKEHRDTLAAKVKELEAKHENLRIAHHEVCNLMRSHADVALLAQYDALTVENARLREALEGALENYRPFHRAYCNSDLAIDARCTCGEQEIIEGWHKLLESDGRDGDDGV